MVKKIKKTTSSLNVLEHILVPKMEIVPQSQVDLILKKYNLTTVKQFPVATKEDPAIIAINAKPGDLIKINRNEPTNKAIYYRVVQ